MVPDAVKTSLIRMYSEIFDNFTYAAYDKALAMKRLKRDPIYMVSLVHEIVFKGFMLQPHQIYNVVINVPAAFLRYVTYSVRLKI
jgi:hypothetical protein